MSTDGSIVAPSPVRWNWLSTSQRGGQSRSRLMQLDSRPNHPRYVDFAMHRVRMLQHFGVTPFLVFDGDYLPSKAATEADRAKRREESKRLGLELHRLGKTSQAYVELQKAVDVTPDMARLLIEDLKRADVPYIVAPYEADAQLTYLERTGVISAILSEDSDLLVFGAKCLLTKLDQYGDCVEINRADFCACREISLNGWSDADFRRMAILSGCDYLASIPKMGLRTAYRLVRKHKSIEAIVRALQFDGQFRVPAGYVDAFKEADLTFLHQRVFCPLQESLVLHTPADKDYSEEELPYVGRPVEAEIAIGVARGDLDPMTKEPLSVKNSVRRSPRTPWVASQRQPVRTASTGAIDVKGNKAIDTFFKAKRTPLAELDPNSFTPSPSQQRLLRQNASTSWSASPTPGASMTRANISVANAASSTLNPAHNSSGGPPRNPWVKPVSVPRPQKRPRLCCEESEEKSGPVAAEAGLEQSRFFTSNDLMTSSAGTQSVKKSKKNTVNIFSDDSIEAIMASMPDTCEPTTTQIFEDDGSIADLCDQARASVNEVASSKQSLTVQNPVRLAEDHCKLSEPALSDGNRDVASEKIMPEPAVDHRELREEFSYHPTAENSERGRNKAVMSTKSKVAFARSAFSVQERGSPLQRLGVGALRRAQSYQATNSKTSSPRSGDVENLSTPNARVSVEKIRGRLSTDRTDRCVLAMMENNSRGSEDLLVPKSEESEESEEEGLPSPADIEGPKIALDVQAFAYGPK